MVTGYGKESCLNAAAEAGDKVEGVVCAGTSSCAGMDMKLTGDAECVGNRACAEADIETGNVVCDGQYGCKRSKIKGNNVYLNGKGSGCKAYIDALYVEINGFYAARKAIIYAAGIRANGYHALGFGIIDSKGRDKVSIDMYGHISGWGAMFICRDGSECELNCFGTGCRKMTFVCLDGAVCNVTPDGCMDTARLEYYDGVDCPSNIDHIPMGVDEREEMNEDDVMYTRYEDETREDEETFDSLNEYETDDIDGVTNEDIQGMDIYDEIVNNAKKKFAMTEGFKILIGVCSAIFCLFVTGMSLLYYWHTKRSGKQDYYLLD